MTKTITKPVVQSFSKLSDSFEKDMFPPLILPDNLDELKDKPDPELTLPEALTEEVQPQPVAYPHALDGIHPTSLEHVLIPMIRRIIPNTIAQELLSVQPLTEPVSVGSVFQSEFQSEWHATKDALLQGLCEHNTVGFWQHEELSIYDTEAKLESIGVSKEFIAAQNAAVLNSKPNGVDPASIKITELQSDEIIYPVKHAEKRIFYIDVGEMPTTAAKEYIQKVKADIKNREPKYGPIDNDEPIPEDYVFVHTDEGRGFRVEKLPVGVTCEYTIEDILNDAEAEHQSTLTLKTASSPGKTQSDVLSWALPLPQKASSDKMIAPHYPSVFHELKDQGAEFKIKLKE